MTLGATSLDQYHEKLTDAREGGLLGMGGGSQCEIPGGSEAWYSVRDNSLNPPQYYRVRDSFTQFLCYYCERDN